MVRMSSVGIGGAVLCFICLVGLLGSFMLALKPLIISQDEPAYMNGVYMSLAFGALAFLGLLIYMIALIQAPTKEK